MMMAISLLRRQYRCVPCWSCCHARDKPAEREKTLLICGVLYKCHTSMYCVHATAKSMHAVADAAFGRQSWAVGQHHCV